MRYVTNSEIEDYLLCRRSWAVRHVFRKGLAREHVNESRTVGNFVHAGLEGYYNSGMTDDAKAIVTYEHAKILDSVVDEDGLLSDEDKQAADNALDYALVILDGYFEWLAEEGADSDLKLLATEDAIEWPILPGRNEVILLGKRDAVFERERDGAKIVFDHKVVQSFADMEKTAHLRSQFKTYLALDRAASTGWVDGLVVNMLRKTKRTGRATPPFYQRLEVRHNDETLRRHWTQMQRTVAHMMADEEMLKTDIGAKHFESVIQPTATKDCSWRCQFYNACHLVDDGSDWQGYIDMGMVDIDPIARYSMEEV